MCVCALADGSDTSHFSRFNGMFSSDQFESKFERFRLKLTFKFSLESHDKAYEESVRIENDYIK